MFACIQDFSEILIFQRILFDVTIKSFHIAIFLVQQNKDISSIPENHYNIFVNSYIIHTLGRQKTDDRSREIVRSLMTVVCFIVFNEPNQQTS